MDDLLQSQLRESCKLSMPEGLKDLMWDISTEVLRAQPSDLIGFITEYLSALLVTREHLKVAGRLFGDICNLACNATLHEDLVNMGLNDEQVKEIEETVWMQFADEKEVNEAELLTKIMKNTELDGSLIPGLLESIRKAFLCYKFENCPSKFLEASSDTELDDVERAARHTLQLYRDTKPSAQEYEHAALNIQRAYRAYGVRRSKTRKQEYLTSDADHLHPWDLEHQDMPSSPASWGAHMDSDSDIADKTRSIHFDPRKKYKEIEVSEGGHTQDSVSTLIRKSKEFIGKKSSSNVGMVTKETKLHTVSSTSLAGSYMRLPDQKPYSPHDAVVGETEETAEKEHALIDYTAEEYDKEMPHGTMNFNYTESNNQEPSERPISIKNAASDSGSSNGDIDEHLNEEEDRH